MKTIIYRPHQALKPFVEAYAITYCNHEDQKGYFYPSNLPVLCFDLHQKHFHESGSQSEFNFPLGFVGVLDRFFTLEQVPKKTIQVIFKPYGAFQFFNVPMHQFVNEGTDMASISPNIKDCIGRLQDVSESDIGCISVLERFLLQQLGKHKDWYSYFNQMGFVCAEIRRNPHNIDIKDICHKSNMSATRFRIHFKEKIGISPKKFAYIEKFQQIHLLLKKQPSLQWMDLVAQFSFFDQSHFIKDFKVFFGCTPSQFWENNMTSIPQENYDMLCL